MFFDKQSNWSRTLLFSLNSLLQKHRFHNWSMLLIFVSVQQGGSNWKTWGNLRAWFPTSPSRRQGLNFPMFYFRLKRVRITKDDTEQIRQNLYRQHWAGNKLSIHMSFLTVKRKVSEYGPRLMQVSVKISVEFHCRLGSPTICTTHASPSKTRPCNSWQDHATHPNPNSRSKNICDNCTRKGKEIRSHF